MKHHIKIFLWLIYKALYKILDSYQFFKKNNQFFESITLTISNFLNSIETNMIKLNFG